MAVLKNRLAEGYYLSNFLSLINFVNSQYQDLLTKDERTFISRFKSLPRHSARLYVRIISRATDLFRIDKLNYSEIKDLVKAAFILEEKGFAIINGKWGREEHLKLFTKVELIEFLKMKDSGVRSSWSRPKCVLEIESNYGEDFELWLSSITTTIHPLGADTVLRFRLLFFGNLEQTLSDFVLEDIGVLKYEKYRLSKKDRFFKTRRDLLDSFKLIDLQGELYLARELRDTNLVEQLSRSVLNIKSTTLKKKKDTICRMSGQFFEKEKDYERALFYYKKCHQVPARERCIRVLEKLDENQKALLLCIKMEKHPLDDSEREFSNNFKEKLKKKLGKDYQKKTRETFKIETLNVSNPRGERVELWSLKQLEKNGIKGFYSENYLWTSLFGLIFWNTIFKSGPGNFFNAFQRGPNDLFTDDFYLKRKKNIDKTISLIGTKGFNEIILKCFDEKYLTANYLVRWKHIKKSSIKLALKRIPAEHLQFIMKKMAQDLKGNSSGFPDLFTYDSKKNNYCLTEIKGPGDQLQASQKRWLRYFEQEGIPYKVLYVRF